MIVPDQSILSVQVAPGSTNTVPALITTAPEPLSIITGGISSTMSTTRVRFTVLRLESVTLYVIIYVPIAPVLTLPVIDTAHVMIPSSVSVAVAPSSV